MEEAMRYVNIKEFTKETVYQINNFRLHKKVHLPLEIVGDRGMSRTETFANKNTKNKFKWKFKFPKVEKLGMKAITSWDNFRKWWVNNDGNTMNDFNDLIVSKI